MIYEIYLKTLARDGATVGHGGVFCVVNYNIKCVWVFS